MRSTRTKETCNTDHYVLISMQEVVAQVVQSHQSFCEFCRKERETSGQPADNLSLETEQKKTFLLLLLLFLLLTYIHTYIYIGQMDSDTLTLERLCRSMLRPVHVLPIMASASFAIGSYGGSKMAEWLVREWNTGDNSECPWKQ